MSRLQQNPWEQPSTGGAADLAAALQAALPQLETARLILRAPRIEDFDTYAAIMMSERAAFMGGPMSRRDAWLDFTQVIATWHLHGHGLWSVTTKADNALVGFVLLGMEYDNREPELGYFFLEEAEGQGFATEAALAARAHGETLALPSLVSYIVPANARSVRLALRIGATPDTQAAEQLSETVGEDVLVLRHWAPTPAVDGGA
ncbi:GNAT family N-acetyltransferase [Aliiroseovarius subalbicans]|uniref:GNAT family N-acetyltransferase n=1 Tax=Aliiroseovarius subalbicans TaxID=2925840 RepID=UPI001F58ACA4|nr:GNAT family N-acetyltransferase [Aliiroseovarius subalbicans]MCI2400690.1 GNAT family N-acetyltransferase [Aliiroseovarius subalbicans]